MMGRTAAAEALEASQPNVQAAGLDASAASSTVQIAGWIADLADDSYAVRQEAADQLLAAGFEVRAALDAVIDGPDPEVRAAARRLVAMIDESEFSRRLADFASDTDGRRGVMLPGWQEFAELVGRDASARALFVDMQREDATRLEAIFRQPAGERDYRWEDRLAQLINLNNANARRASTAPAARFATMFFLGSLPDARMPDGVAALVARLAQRPPISEVMASQSKREQNAFRRLVAAWVVRGDCRNDEVLGQRLSLIFIFELKEALPLALKIVSEPSFLTVSAQRRVHAMLAIGRLGSAENIPVLEPMLADESDLMARPTVNLPQLVGTSVQVRDVALAAILHLAGQNLQDFGFANPRRHDQVLFEPASLGFDSNERRMAALSKWQTWKADHMSPPAAAR